VAAALLAGAFAGFINAFLVVNVGLNCIVVTLGTGTLLGGLAVAINLETVTGISPVLVEAVRTQVLRFAPCFLVRRPAHDVGLVRVQIHPARPLSAVLRGWPGSRASVGIRVDAIRFGSLMTASIVAALAGVRAHRHPRGRQSASWRRILAPGVLGRLSRVDRDLPWQVQRLGQPSLPSTS